MTKDKIVVYRAFDSHVEAHIIKSLIESNGIECFLSDDNFVSLDPLLSQAVGGIKLHVFEKDIDKIDTIIKSENIENETVCGYKSVPVLRKPVCQVRPKHLLRMRIKH